MSALVVVALPAAAEPGGGKAAIILERIEAQITYQTLVLQATKNELIAYGAAPAPFMNA